MAVNTLLSYAFWRGQDLWAVRNRLTCGRILIDSGAFSVFTKGAKIDILDYAAWLKDNWGAWDHAVTLDVIGDPTATRKNTRRLHDLGVPVIPVFTAGESLHEFDAMVRDCGYVMVGGGVAFGMHPDALVRRMGVLQHRAEDLGGGIHALGMGATWQLRLAKPYSADSSNISTAFRYGALLYWDGMRTRLVVVRNREKMRAAMPHLLAHGFDVATIFQSGLMVQDAETRTQVTKSMVFSFAVCDEMLTQRNQVPVPHGIRDTPGPHLYAALNPTSIDGMILASAAIHSPNPPAVYAPYQAGHVCHPGPKKGDHL